MATDEEIEVVKEFIVSASAALDYVDTRTAQKRLVWEKLYAAINRAKEVFIRKDISFTFSGKSDTGEEFYCNTCLNVMCICSKITGE